MGWATHAAAVARLRASYDAIPAGRPGAAGQAHLEPLPGPVARATLPGLDVSGLAGVIAVDVAADGSATADVQGMCTYEDLVDVTLAHGFIPYVVPQLRSITLGGAVTGLGIESTSFRNGLPHESVLEMDVLTGDGAGRHHAARATTCSTRSPTPTARSATPPGSGSASRRPRRTSTCGTCASTTSTTLAKTIEVIVEQGEHDGVRVDGLDGVVFEPGEAYLTLATWRDEASTGSTGRAATTSDYTGMDLYFRSLQQRETDTLTTYDYLWRWDTDWFWCSGAFGLQNPRDPPAVAAALAAQRRLPPARRRWRTASASPRASTVRAASPTRERVIQDIEVPVERTPEFLRWFDADVGMRPVWLCPLRASRGLAVVPPRAGRDLRQRRLLGHRRDRAGRRRRRRQPRRRGARSPRSAATSRSTPTPTTTGRPSTGSTASPTNAGSSSETDPDNRLTGLYEKAVNRR